MLLYTNHTYWNTRSDGKRFVHETKERAITASDPNKEEYSEIAAHQSQDTRRCDPCLEKGHLDVGLFHKMANKDFCQHHRIEFEKSLTR